MWNENRNTTILKVLYSIIYGIIEQYVCVDYLCLQQGLLYLKIDGFENTTFDNIPGIYITEVLMNIMSYHG